MMLINLFIEVGWPILKKNNIPVTLFVNTSTIHKNNKNYLNWDQIRQLKEEGVLLVLILIVIIICQI